ncbi:sensor histidine kinase KdpD [Microbacterium sp. CIAB417]|uniref:sensor histidine kinase n=1 Tax=Microbacterium sp. CIAB417 TaxID=2860287 RepID=UPI001FABC604|nr:HAMP domain-containing sensor histidine kinase [Microbacterium sp. CIAB417]
MPLPDLLIIVGMSLACALVVGALGLLALRLLHRRPLIVQLCVVVLASVVSLAAGVLAVALAMYISPHDFLVVVTVTSVSAVVSVGVALLLGLRIARAGDELRRLTHAIGDGALVDEHPSVSPSAEFEALADELAETSHRLAQAREEVQAIDASRRELVAWISHDLRSPLSGLRAMTEALEDGLAADTARFHHQMRLQVDRLTSLVDNLFELSKISSGTLVLNLEPLSLHDLVSDAAAELAAVAQAKSIVLVERTSPDHTLVGDARELSRVVSNLLMNALEHTPTGGEVRISTVQDAEGVTLSVQDSGTGIAEEDLHRIFDPGWRGTHARTPIDGIVGSSGAGLGLAIVRGIVEAHQGRISATNETTGCRFDVRLPSGSAG